MVPTADPLAIVGLPPCDASLPARVQEIYMDLVKWASAAKVPVRQIDSVAFTGAARCLYSIEQAERISEDESCEQDTRIAALNLIEKQGRSLQKWVEMIGGTAMARARLGQKPEPERKAGPLAQLLARRQAAQG